MKSLGKTIQSTLEVCRWWCFSRVEVQSLLLEIFTTKGLACLVWQRSVNILFYPCVYLNLGTNQRPPLVAAFCIGAPLLARLTLYHVTSIPVVFPIVHCCQCLHWKDKSCLNHLTLFVYTPAFFIIFGVIVVMQNTHLIFFNLCGYIVNMFSWWLLLIYFRLTMR